MKDHLGVVFLGDCAGKSTLIGQLLLKEGSNGKFRKQEKNENKQTFAQYFEGLTDQVALKYSALILKKLEIQNGRTIEFHNDRFNTQKRVYSLIDTPSQRVYLKNMVAGITFASAIVLVLSGQENEFEKELTNIVKDQLTIAYTMGIKQIVCCINKMETINWSKEKFDEIRKQMDKYLQMVGFHPKRTKYIPISAYQEQNIFKLSEHTPWYIGTTLVNALDEFIQLEQQQQNKKEYLISVLESHYNNEQCVIIGRIEEGKLKVGQKMNLNGNEVECVQIERYNEIIPQSVYGDIVGFKLSKIVNKIKRGTIISSDKQICQHLQAQFLILDGQGLKTGVVMCFYFCTQVIECQIEIEMKIQRHTGNVLEEKPKKLNQGDTGIIKVIPRFDLIADIYSQTNCLGRFAVIMNQKLIGVGFVKDIVLKK